MLLTAIALGAAIVSTAIISIYDVAWHCFAPSPINEIKKYAQLAE
jgi:hypothetical protein